MELIHKLIKKEPREVLHKLVFKSKKKLQRALDFSLSSIHVETIDGPVFLDKIDVDYDREVILKNAELIIHEGFQVLGVQVDGVHDIQWNKDYCTGSVWENDYFQDIVTVDLSSGNDVKIPWELSRLQFLPTLALAFEASGNDIYKEEIKRCIYSWIEGNPYKHSVNWTCSMEVAIRAINIIFTCLLMPSLMTEKHFFELVCNSLFEHGRYIKGNLETYDMNYNNHYLSNLIGLVWIGSFLGMFVKGRAAKKCKGWVSFAAEELHAELHKQIFDDGTDYESSTAYHRLVAEIFLLDILASERFGFKLPDEDLELIGKMLVFLSLIKKPNGEIPIIGDADDGRMVILDDYVGWDRRGCDYLFNQYDSLISSSFWGSLDLSGVKRQSVAFAAGGYYLLRNNSIYCMIHCGPLSMNGHGGHSHNDQLAIEVNINGKDFVIDSGPGVYSRNEAIRNLFRSTKSHSTLELAGVEQNTIIKGKMFELPEETHSQCISFSEDSFVGVHDGYLKQGYSTKRHVRVSKNAISIEDCLSFSEEGTNDRRWRQNFILDPEVAAEILDDHNIRLSNGETVVSLSSSEPVSIRPVLISPAYGTFILSRAVFSAWTDNRRIVTSIVLDDREAGFEGE